MQRDGRAQTAVAKILKPFAGLSRVTSTGFKNKQQAQLDLHLFLFWCFPTQTIMQNCLKDYLKKSLDKLLQLNITISKYAGSMQFELAPCCPPWICSKSVYFIYCLSYLVSKAGQFFSLLPLTLIATFGCLHTNFSSNKSLTYTKKRRIRSKL